MASLLAEAMTWDRQRLFDPNRRHFPFNDPMLSFETNGARTVSSMENPVLKEVIDLALLT
jgi:hypothetical protein